MTEIKSGQDSELKYAPKDKYKVVYFCFAFLGACTLLPWNFFCTATMYFQFRLRTDKNATTLDYNDLNMKQISFPNQMAIFSMIPLALTNILNLIIKDKINASVRFLVGFALVTAMFVITVILVGIEVTDIAFLVVTFVSIVFINIGCALYQGSLMGLLSLLPGNYIGVFLEGQSLAGILTAVTSIILTPLNVSMIGQGGIFFSIPIIFNLLAFVMYYLITKSKFFIHHLGKANLEPSFFSIKKVGSTNGEENAALTADSSEHSDHLSNENIFKKSLVYMREVIYYGMGVFFTLCVTLAVFPALLINITPMHYSPDDPWTQKYYKLVVIFLLFNLTEYVGRVLATRLQFPKVSRKKLILCLTISRFIFVILIMFFNQAGKMHFPSIFVHDAYLIIFIILFGSTNGYLLNLCFMYAPQSVSQGNQEGAGVAMCIYMSFGLGAGVSLSYLLAWML